jgi:hypothetical protein
MAQNREIGELGQIVTVDTSENGLTVNGSVIVGNSSINAVVNSSTIALNGTAVVNNTTFVFGSKGVSANGSLGLDSQVLTTNGSAAYWSSAGVNTNATYVWSNAHTFNGVVSFAQTAVGTVNNALYLNGTNLSTLQGQITSNASAAYTNAVSYTDGKILTANSAITSNAATSYTNAVSYTDSKILTANSAITGNAATAYSNAVSYTDGKILTANSAITGNAATAYTNAVSYTDGKIATANTAITGNAATAYTNATIFASNVSNINSGTLAEARLPYRMNQNVRNSDTVEFAGMTLTGNLVVSGNVNIIGANNLSISDNMIYLNSNNDVSNPDLGIAANYNDGTYAHTGIFRDASDGIWKIFDSYTPEPDANVYIDTTNTSFHLANFQANTIYGGNTSTNWFISNTGGTYVTGTVNAASHTVGTSFTANATVVNAVSFYAGTTLIGNTTGPYGKTEGNLNVNSALTANNSTNLGGTAAASYQLNSTLNANIASYLPTYTGVVNGSSHTVSSSFIANATGVYHTGTVNAATISTGSVNVINASGLTTTANVNIGAAGELIITAGAGIYANGGLGSAGQVLTSNATSVYWASPAASGVTSVATGNGLTGGTITTSGTVSVLANNGITANSTGLFVTQGTGAVVNATGVHVNSTYIGTLTANNATFAFGLSAASTTATGSTVVTRDANGDFNGRYINASYHNSTDDISAGTISHIMAKFGDNYHRSATAAKVATFISGQSMNISGSATSATTATTATNQSGGTVSATTGTFSSYIRRSSAAGGWLDGAYASVETVNTPGCIYTIGSSSYQPTATALNTMYGVGYTYRGGTALGTVAGSSASAWGFYGCSAGTPRWFLNTDDGSGWFAGNLYVNSGTQVVYNSGTWSININGSAGSATTATTATNLSGGSVAATSITASSDLTLTTVPFFLNAKTVASNYTISGSYNAHSTGPITINTGVTVTISTGATWVVL